MEYLYKLNEGVAEYGWVSGLFASCSLSFSCHDGECCDGGETKIFVGNWGCGEKLDPLLSYLKCLLDPGLYWTGVKGRERGASLLQYMEDEECVFCREVLDRDAYPACPCGIRRRRPEGQREAVRDRPELTSMPEYYSSDDIKLEEILLLESVVKNTNCWWFPMGKLLIGWLKCIDMDMIVVMNAQPLEPITVPRLPPDFIASEEERDFEAIVFLSYGNGEATWRTIRQIFMGCKQKAKLYVDSLNRKLGHVMLSSHLSLLDISSSFYLRHRLSKQLLQHTWTPSEYEIQISTTHPIDKLSIMFERNRYFEATIARLVGVEEEIVEREFRQVASSTFYTS